MAAGDVYDLALANAGYRWSCSTFSVWTLLALGFQRDWLFARYGAEGLVFSSMGAVQAVVSWLGDVHYLKKNEAFWPDLVLASTLVSWAVRLHWREWAFRCSMAVSGAFFCSALFLNHFRKHPRWWWCHVGWHMLPLELYLSLTPVSGFYACDRVLAWTYVWALVALCLGGGDRFVAAARPRDAHAVLAGGALLAAHAVAEAPAALSRAALAFSAGYWAVSAACRGLRREWPAAAARAVAVALVLSRLGEPPATARATVLLTVLVLLEYAAAGSFAASEAPGSSSGAPATQPRRSRRLAARAQR